MARISVDDVKAWVEDSKLRPQALDIDHLSHIEEEVLAQLAPVYTTTLWLDKATTPRLVQVIIAKTYAGWLYNKFYSENQSLPNTYAQMILQNAKTLISGILDGTIEIPGSIPSNPVGASFYPNDISSYVNPSTGDYDPSRGVTSIPTDTSSGPAKFSLGKVF